MKKIILSLVIMSLNIALLAKEETISSKDCKLAYDVNFTYSIGFQIETEDEAYVPQILTRLEEMGFNVTVMDDNKRLRGQYNSVNRQFEQQVPNDFEYAIGVSFTNQNAIYMVLLRSNPNDKKNATVVSEVDLNLYSAGIRSSDIKEALIDMGMSLLPSCTM